jgi:hypothetical protein
MKMLAGPTLCFLHFILYQSRVSADKMEGHVLEGVKRSKKEQKGRSLLGPIISESETGV